jgi:hypothetical protein
MTHLFSPIRLDETSLFTTFARKLVKALYVLGAQSDRVDV